LSEKEFDDEKRLENFKKHLIEVVERNQEKMTLREYTLILFPILERAHFYLLSFDLKTLAITAIDNMVPEESVLQLVEHEDFNKKSTPMKVVSFT